MDCRTNAVLTISKAVFTCLHLTSFFLIFAHKNNDEKGCKIFNIVWVLSLPFQWIYLDNYIVSGVNTLLAIYWIALYNNNLH